MTIPERETPQAQDHAAQEDEDSEVIKKHKALRHQSSIDPQDYPKSDRKDQSLVRKPGQDEP